MKAITLHQPWATFIVMGWKTIETRTHQRFKSLADQRIAIHAAKKRIDTDALVNPFRPYMDPLQCLNLWEFVNICRGKIICTATVTEARWAPNVDFVERKEWNKKAMCETAGMFCLFLEDVKPIVNKIPFRGRQGIFDMPDDLIVGL